MIIKVFRIIDKTFVNEEDFLLYGEVFIGPENSETTIKDKINSLIRRCKSENDDITYVRLASYLKMQDNETLI